MLDRSASGDDGNGKERNGKPPASLSDRLAALFVPRLRRAARWIQFRSGMLAAAAVLLLAVSATGLVSARTSLLLMVAAASALAWRDVLRDEPVLRDEIRVAEAGAIALRAGQTPPRQPTVDVWRQVIDALPEPAAALDRLGVVQHANRQMRDLYPNVRDGVPLSQALRHPDLIAALDNARTVGQPIAVQIVERVPVDRRIAATVSRLTAVRAPSAEPALLVTFRDMSEQDRLDEMRADFVANASHELRTPLASLRGFVETLQGPARDDAAARERFLGLMASQAIRMSRLIDDLLSLSRVEMRVHLVPGGVVDLNEVAAYVRQTLAPLADADRVEVVVHTLDTPARIRGDRDEIVQLVQNLSQNAIKYGRPGGRVDIRIERAPATGAKPATVTLAVVDDGPGIAPEHLPRLTERFYRVSTASSREKGGTGLGLAIVKHIVQRHRGALRISSELGVGSRFAAEFEADSSGSAE